MKAVTDADFQVTISESETPVLVHFMASWAAPCRTLTPSLEEIEAEHGDTLKIVEVDCDKSPRTVRAFRIQNLPTMLLFMNGQPVHAIAGVQRKAALLEELADYI
ncbi:thioredoxin family protein [Streptomyces sp. NPDC001178]